MPPSNCFETGRRSQTQSSVRPCGAETANGCLVLDRRGITAERREGELERPEDFVSAPPERVRRAFALLTRTYHGCRLFGNNVGSAPRTATSIPGSPSSARHRRAPQQNLPQRRTPDGLVALRQIPTKLRYP